MFAHSLTFLAVTLCLVSLAFANCEYICPDFFDGSEVVAVGQRLFDAVVGDVTCPCNLTSGPVYLFRPGDKDFVPQKVGYWNYANASDPGNTILAPTPKVLGYGFRVVIVPDRDSPTHEPQVSPTFSIVTAKWFDKTYDQISLLAPDPYYPADWDNVGQQLIAFSDDNSKFNTFSILLYKSSDVSWGPLVLAKSVTPATSTAPATDYYFTYPGKLPTGPGFQFVFVPHVKATAKVITVSGPITIVDDAVTTNTFPYPYTGIRTLNAEPTGK